MTHYQRLLDYIVPDYVHVLSGGRIVKSGGKELALELEGKGYGWIEARSRWEHDRDDAGGRQASAVAGGARGAAAGRPALAAGPPRRGGVALRRARVPDGARRGLAVHQRRADRRRPSSGRARAGQADSPTSSTRCLYADAPLPARDRQRPLLAGAVRACATCRTACAPARSRRRVTEQADVVAALLRPARRLRHARVRRAEHRVRRATAPTSTSPTAPSSSSRSRSCSCRRLIARRS